MTSNIVSNGGAAASKIARVMKYGQRFYSIPTNYNIDPTFSSSQNKENPMIKNITKGNDQETASMLLPSVTTILKMINKPFLINWEKNVMMQALKEQYTTEKPSAGFESSSQEHQWLDAIISTSKQRAEEIKNEASSFGTRAHEWIDKTIQLKDEDLLKATAELLVDDVAAEAEEEEEQTIDEDLKNLAIAFNDWKQESGLTLERRDTIVWSEKYGYAGAVDAVGRKKDGQLVAIDWKTSSMISNEYALQVAAYSKALEELTGEVIKEAWIVRFHKKLPLYETKQVKDLDRSFQAFLGVLELWKAYNENDLYLDMASYTKLSDKNNDSFFFGTKNNVNNSNNNSKSNIYTPQQKNKNNIEQLSITSTKTVSAMTATDQTVGQQSTTTTITTSLTPTPSATTTATTTATITTNPAITTSKQAAPRFIVKNKGLAIQ